MKSCVACLTKKNKISPGSPALTTMQIAQTKSATTSPRQCTESAPDFIQIGSFSAELYPVAAPESQHVQLGHCQVTKAIRQVVSWKLERPKGFNCQVQLLSDSQVNRQVVYFSARSFELTRPGVAPPLVISERVNTVTVRSKLNPIFV